MKKLMKGIREFQSKYYCQYYDLFEQLAHGQHPTVLFITCSDSRIDPNLITQTQPGDLFVIRNAGNMIPPYGATNGGEGAAVEYAVHALGIEQIIVCGHSNCGAMKGLLKLESLSDQMPLVHDWLKQAEATRRLVKENYASYDGDELLEITTAENVLTQLENLRTYPIIHSRLHQGKLKLYGWLYSIETGEVLTYDADHHAFLPPQGPVLEEPSEKLPPIQVASSPVVCELPGTQGNGNGSTSVASSTPQELHSSSANGSSPFPWLSPEQAERIYRGASR